MTVYIICDEDNSVLHVGTTPIGDNPIEVEVDDQKIFQATRAFSYVNGSLLFDEDKFNTIILEVM